MQTGSRPPSVIHIGDGRAFSRAEFLSLLDTYNCFLRDEPHLHLHSTENAGEVTVEGFLVISWGVKRPIRLMIQDEKPILPPCEKPQSPLESPDPISPLGGRRGMTRWGEYDNLLRIDELEESRRSTPNTLEDSPVLPRVLSGYESKTLQSPRPKPITEESSVLFRTLSDASLVKKRVKSKTVAERQRARQHRFSINGHFYNYKTSIFTPSYGATSRVRTHSGMSTEEVIGQLLHKFKIENDQNEFALYCIHQSGERRKLGSSELPLLERILQGPSESIMRVFLMDTDEQEVSNDVAQYLNLELPILERVLWGLEEEENQQIRRIISKYRQQHHLLNQWLNSRLAGKTECDTV
ncbi:ras association domain-containing protein 6 [Clupea harengus]|uniref:Ras association domain-containing protein 6 n=1 Tax=Clupea harengus TaxID=7950 RepID=A0A6P8G0L6_CLUHA|nr:ras association domain-containing protein 6 [Clupea harengus]